MYRPRHASATPHPRPWITVWLALWVTALAACRTALPHRSSPAATVAAQVAWNTEAIRRLTERVDDYDDAWAMLAPPAPLRVIEGGRSLGTPAERPVLLQQRRDKTFA